MSSPSAAACVAGIVAYQLTKAGTEVVSLEQGPWLTTENDFTHDHDELRYNQRRAMMVDLSQETWTWPSPKDTALPMRQYGSFNPLTRASVGRQCTGPRRGGASTRPISCIAATSSSA
ncbi:MAG: hypothetical protein R2853_20410 [Thermomicrobiales bacterium]